MQFSRCRGLDLNSLSVAAGRIKVVMLLRSFCCEILEGAQTALMGLESISEVPITRLMQKKAIVDTSGKSLFFGGEEVSVIVRV